MITKYSTEACSTGSDRVANYIECATKLVEVTSGTV